MTTLICCIGVCVASFSYRYLNGDRAKKRFYMYLPILIVTLCTMVNSNHLVLLLTTWSASNFLLTRLMLHKSEWKAAVFSSNIAGMNFFLGTIFLGIAFILLHISTHETSIATITKTQTWGIESCAAGFFILLAAMTQSGLWPFHRWLLSSLNSPTPVSAIMHAGQINAGGFLLARFGLLFAEHSLLLNFIFIFGILTATVGMIWKLMQNDVKRMLACSTISQMGYMIAQCGLGLFPSAIAHLCWHGLFKAYLFLASGSAAQDKKLQTQRKPNILDLLFSLVCGTLGAYVFSLVNSKQIFLCDTSLFITFIVLITGAQIGLTIVTQNISARVTTAILFTSIAGMLYGLSVNFFESILEPLSINQPIALNTIHVIAMLVLGGMWLAMQLANKKDDINVPQWKQKLYVHMLNTSQPHPKTITAHRKSYQF